MCVHSPWVCVHVCVPSDVACNVPQVSLSVAVFNMLPISGLDGALACPQLLRHMSVRYVQYSTVTYLAQRTSYKYSTSILQYHVFM